MLKFPDLTADDIEVRVSRAWENGVELLLYKDARVDMRMLDEAVGPEGWQRRHDVINGVTYCSVGIRTDAGEWVWKQDCGTAGSIEAEKSTASDAFKRACFNWGIGRELYTAPRIVLWNGDTQADQLARIRPKGERFACYDDFAVRKCIVEDHMVKALWIVNESLGGRTVYVMKPEGDGDGQG